MKWLHLKDLILFPVIGLTVLTVNCSFPGDSNGSGVGNGMICGKLYEPDGVTPAVGAVVTVWERCEKNPIDSINQIQPSTGVVQTRTDEEGMYSIVRIGSGKYAIEALDDFQNIASIDSIFVPNEWTILDTLTDTLKAPGAIRGSINIDTGRICCHGTFIKEYPISNGSFFISPLSEGFYLLSTPDGQMSQVRVSSGDTTDVKIEVLEKLLFVDRISISFDSTKHSTIVNWEVLELVNYWNVLKASFLGCNLYRKISGDSSFGQPLNGSELIHDTKFIDTTAFPGFEYQYAVAAVDSAHRIGPLSEIISTATSPIIVNLDTLTSLIETGCNRSDYCYFIPSHDQKYVNLLIRQSNLNQQYDATEGSLANSSSWPLPDYACCVRTETVGDQIFYWRSEKFDSIQYLPSKIFCMNKTGNERIIETFSLNSRFEGFDVLGNTIAIVSSTGWNKQDSTANNYSITRSLTTDGMVVYSIKTGHLQGEFRDIRICADGSFTLFFMDHILKLDASGKEKATIKLPPKSQNFNFFEISDTLYMFQHYDFDSNGIVIVEYAVYNLFSELLYKVKRRAVTSLLAFSSLCFPAYLAYNPTYLASNGDIYIQAYDKATEKTVIHRLPNPLHNDR